MIFQVTQEVRITQTFEIEANSIEELLALCENDPHLYNFEPISGIDRDDNSEEPLSTEVKDENDETVYYWGA